MTCQVGFYPFQVSFFSTSAELSAKERYPYFLRTIPSDDAQAQAMVELIKMFKWQYVSLLYEESSYGEKVGRSRRSDSHTLLPLNFRIWICGFTVHFQRD
jgi:hypothetical protein